ncbi:MAG TPA: portal protein, partial [Gammaproteobacteria bacterium]|nr:portal protein [Gammaproteobacteria bacterium]
TIGALVDTFDPDWSKRSGKTPDWSKFSDGVKTSWERKAYQDTAVVCWYVGPNREENPNRLGSRFLPYISVYWERNRAGHNTKLEASANGDARVLKESGFNEFPVLVPRWDVSGEDWYGTNGPGMDTLGDVKALQVMQRKKAKAVEKSIDPSLVGPTELRNQKTSLLPGDITYLNVREGQLGLRAIHEVNANIDHIRQDIRETQYRISRGFYEDLFLMLASSDGVGGVQPKTAREIDERHEEKLLALGPVLERFADELHDPLVDRVFAIMQRAGLIPEPPPELDGVELKVEYLSIMAQAQKSVSLVGQDRFVQTIMGMAEVFPEVVDKFDAMQAIDDYGEMLGVNPNQILSDEAAEQRAAERAEQQQQAQAAESIPKVAAGVKSMADAKMGESSALEAVLSGANAAAAGG